MKLSDVHVCCAVMSGRLVICTLDKDGAIAQRHDAQDEILSAVMNYLLQGGPRPFVAVDGRKMVLDLVERCQVMIETAAPAGPEAPPGAPS